jgi:hypothetical protein
VAALSRPRIAHGTLQQRWLLPVLVFVIALGALATMRSGGEEPGHDARAAALADPAVTAYLARHGYDRVVTKRLDGETTRVAFFDGPRIVLEAAVPERGEIRNLNRHAEGHARLGSEVGQTLPALALMLGVFALAMVRRPLRQVANLDAAALAAFAAPIVLLNERFQESSVLASTALLVYLSVRCVLVARTGYAPRGRFAFRVRGIYVGAAAAGLVLLSIPGGLVSDVGLASMAGATRTLDGALPYGGLDIGELVHGDTYPLLAYLAYVPGALVTPVRDGFGNLDGALWVATGFALVAAGALARRAGARAALAFLAFPPVMSAASSGSNDTVAAAFVALALGAGATAALAAAGWVKLAPFAAVPLWVVAARRKSAALAGAALVTLAAGVALLVLGGPAAYREFSSAVSFQAERGSLMSPWSVLGAGGVQVVFQAAVVAGIAAACIAVWRDRRLAADPRRVCALGAAVLLAVQLAANYWSYTYLAWVFPLLAVALLTDRRAPAG